MKSLLLSAVLLAPAVFASTAGATVSPPPATGSAPVGFTRTTLTDSFRSESLAGDIGPRRLALRVWYPASAPGAAVARTLSPAEQVAWEDSAGLEANALDGLGSAATTGAPAAAGSHPVLLMSPGLGATSAFMGAHASDLASHGYVVVGIDVPGETQAVDSGDGVLAPMAPGLANASVASIELRSRDMRFVLSRLGSLRGAGRLDLQRVGAFGHSNGSATTATAMLADRRLRAGVNLDGAIFGSVVERGLDRPFGTLHGAGPDEAYASMFELRSHLRGPRPYAYFPRAAHNSFTDFVWLAPQLDLDPVALEVGTIDPAAAVSRQTMLLRRFFGRYVAA
jgi:predicted dienelactone hydrolase